MPSTYNPIRGIPLTDKPARVSKCGMSHAVFAQNRTSNRWYALSIEEKILGSPLEFDFYKHGSQPVPSNRSTVITKEFSKL